MRTGIKDLLPVDTSAMDRPGAYRDLQALHDGETGFEPATARPQPGANSVVALARNSLCGPFFPACDDAEFEARQAPAIGADIPEKPQFATSLDRTRGHFVSTSGRPAHAAAHQASGQWRPRRDLRSGGRAGRLQRPHASHWRASPHVPVADHRSGPTGRPRGARPGPSSPSSRAAVPLRSRSMG